jgi:hypothetical protein
VHSGNVGLIIIIIIWEQINRINCINRPKLARFGRYTFNRFLTQFFGRAFDFRIFAPTPSLKEKMMMMMLT